MTISSSAALQHPAPKVKLVLDIDETLLHTAETTTGLLPGHTFLLPGKVLSCVLRPGLQEFFEYVGDNFDIILFTAGTKEYAEGIRNILDPHHQAIKAQGGSPLIKAVYSRDSLTKDASHPGGYYKDLLTVIRYKIQLSSVILVDNNVNCFAPQQRDNGYHIPDFYGDPHDRELNKLLNFLLVNNRLDNPFKDVRSTLRTLHQPQQPQLQPTPPPVLTTVPTPTSQYPVPMDIDDEEPVDLTAPYDRFAFDPTLPTILDEEEEEEAFDVTPPPSPPITTPPPQADVTPPPPPPLRRSARLATKKRVDYTKFF